MTETLFIYSTTDGQTTKICNKLIENSFKNEAKLCSLDEAIKEDLKIYKKIIIGASIRYGKHNPNVFNFIKKKYQYFK